MLSKRGELLKGWAFQSRDGLIEFIRKSTWEIIGISFCEINTDHYLV